MRLKPIIENVRGLTITEFGDADLGVQTSIIYSMVNSCTGTVRGYKAMLDDPENKDSAPEVRKNWEHEITRASNISYYLMAFLHRVSHAVVAEDAEVAFTSVYDDGNEISGDDTIENVAIKQHPYAWAKSKLIQRGIWPMTMTEAGPVDDTNWSWYSDITLWKYDAIIKKMAARVLGAWIVQIRDTGDIVPTKRSGADVILLSMCHDVIKLGKIEDDELLAKRIVSFAKNNCGGIVYVGQEKYSAHELYEAYEDIQDQDEVDLLKRDIRQTTREIRRSVHEKLVQNTAYEAIRKSLDGLVKSGATKEMITDYIDGFAEQLNAKQYKELMSWTANTSQT